MTNVRRGEWTIGALLLVIQQDLHELATDLEEATFAESESPYPQYVFTSYLTSVPALIAALRDASEKAGGAWADIYRDRAYNKTVTFGTLPTDELNATPKERD
jgi:hypothetical protein